MTIHKMPRPRVLIDVDGVLRDFIGSLTGIYLREYPDHQVATVDSRRLEDFYPIGEAIYPFMNEQFAEEILVDAPAFPGAVEALHRWEDRYEIVIVTAQPPEGRFPTLSWLGKNRVPSNEIHMMHEKHRIAGAVLLDDFVDNLEQFQSTGRLAVCYDQPWNGHWQGPRVASVDAFFGFIAEYFREQRHGDMDGILLA